MFAITSVDIRLFMKMRDRDMAQCFVHVRWNFGHRLKEMFDRYLFR